MTYRFWRKKLFTWAGLSGESRFKIVDVGCGKGSFLKCIEKWYPAACLWGLDNNEQVLAMAAKQLPRTKLIREDCKTLPFADSTIDVVSALQVIEHINEPDCFVNEVKRVLKNKGLLLIATPNPSGICARILKNNWHGFRQEHIALKPPDAWNKLLENNGFEIIDEGTTGLTGFRLMRRMPFALINWLPMSIMGYFKWRQGESYVVVSRKVPRSGNSCSQS